MAVVNSAYNNLAAGYLFPEIARRTRAFLEKNPGAKVLRLGIGDTTEPLPPVIIFAMKEAVDRLSRIETYSGYGPDQGSPALREALALRYRSYGAEVDPLEIFVSDGAKPDSANIQSIFGLKNTVAVQDPAYPVYVDSNVMAGRGRKFRNGKYAGLVYMPCTQKNGFFPALPAKKVDLIYLCCPNNPTGTAATREQLGTFVEYAMAKKSVIIFDAAYAAYITNPRLPRSIFEVPGAQKCAIEINSFSKEAGFTGVRLGWTVVPRALVASGAPAGKLHAMWGRRQATMFNGPSVIAEAGGIAALTERGQKECGQVSAYYMENARIIRQGLEQKGIKVFGGVNAPYVWMLTPNRMKSWKFFDKLLNEAHVVGTPGAGFGPSGEGYLRLSAFGHRKSIQEAVESIRKNLRI
jgi:LL-diaminopimelate aminotransferase